MTLQDPKDPKGLIAESYRMDGITLAECRSIFLDWALSVGPDIDAAQTIEGFLALHGPANPDHPMTAVLREGRQRPDAARRRGGRRGRLST